MTPETGETTDHSSREIVTTRVFEAPRGRVWRAWTEPAHIVNWWGPAHFTSPHATTDPRPGGEFHFCMRSPEGQDYWSKGEYLEIDPPRLIVSTMYFSDAEGRQLKPSDYGMGPDIPEIMHDTVRFEALGPGRTRLTLERATPLSVSKKYGEDQGWNESLEKFAAEVARAAGQG